MNIFDFDNRGRAYVCFEDFRAYVLKDAYEGDYERESEELWCYYNSAGCKLAKYNKEENYGIMI